MSSFLWAILYIYNFKGFFFYRFISGLSLLLVLFVRLDYHIKSGFCRRSDFRTRLRKFIQLTDHNI
jgi:hypothetical protein